ncbi:hypothetical protein B0T14DRAFT_498543 [Immersiella caudata]|uniref:Uncharacterized protein n=1 Tax=Immersiella caudata TaxID=314043 RepID=A0AA39WLG4_9PEZI|nr:hypothetical protein B0T14DRAFT_498543 [Immersiella caudata]
MTEKNPSVVLDNAPQDDDDPSGEAEATPLLDNTKKPCKCKCKSSLNLFWFKDGCAVDWPKQGPQIISGSVEETVEGTLYLKSPLPWWRLPEDLNKWADDKLAADTRTDPLYPSRTVYTRTIAFDYYMVWGRLKDSHSKPLPVPSCGAFCAQCVF